MTCPPRPNPLDAVPIFSALDTAEKDRLGARLETRRLMRGDVLVRQGDPADTLYIVVSGRFAVTTRGRRQPVTEIGPGQPVGEIAFLTGGTRTATVSAMRDSLVLALGRDEFESLAAELPGLWRSLTATLAQRLAATTAAAAPPPDPRPRTIAIIRAGHSELPETFLKRLTSVFATHARTHLITPDNAELILGAAADLDSAEATQALNALERQHEYVILVADPELTPWSEKAIRHADLVLAAGRHDADETPNALEAAAARFLAPDARRLVLLHERRMRLSGTARWLRERDIAMHHHVALDTDADIERLFRFVNRTALGLVTCGGGALCAAHVGVYKALVEAGYMFDIMGGTSGGSAMAAAFMLRSTPEDIDASVHDMFVANKAMHRYTIPRYSLLDHAHFDSELRRLYGDNDIEDLWLPYFAVSTNLSRYALETHRTGKLWTAIRASASIPVLLPPVYIRGGEMLVDGGLLDNVPIRAMHDLKSGPNIVVSFLAPELERFAVDYDALPSRLELIKRSMRPNRNGRLPEAPGMVSVLMRSLMANRHAFHRHLTPDDLLLVPPVGKDIGLLDWHRHAELFATAYAWTRSELTRLAAAVGDDTGEAAAAKPGSIPGL